MHSKDSGNQGKWPEAPHHIPDLNIAMPVSFHSNLEKHDIARTLLVTKHPFSGEAIDLSLPLGLMPRSAHWNGTILNQGSRTQAQCLLAGIGEMSLPGRKVRTASCTSMASNDVKLCIVRLKREG